MRFFSRQQANTRTCVQFALNNCLQQNCVSESELDSIALHLAVTEMAEDSNLYKNKNKKSVADYYRHLRTSNGWSIRVARQYFLDHSIAHEWDVAFSDLLEFNPGRYFLRTRIDQSLHAIAIVDGMLLDSLLDKPIPWTRDLNYTILLACRVIL